MTTATTAQEIDRNPISARTNCCAKSAITRTAFSGR
jgi:hypothetical protein